MVSFKIYICVNGVLRERETHSHYYYCCIIKWTLKRPSWKPTTFAARRKVWWLTWRRCWPAWRQPQTICIASKMQSARESGGFGLSPGSKRVKDPPITSSPFGHQASGQTKQPQWGIHPGLSMPTWAHIIWQVHSFHKTKGEKHNHTTSHSYWNVLNCVVIHFWHWKKYGQYIALVCNEPVIFKEPHSYKKKNHSKQ